MTYDTRKGWAGGNQLVVGDSTGSVGFQRSFYHANESDGEQEEDASVRTVTFQVNGFGFPEAVITAAVAGNAVRRRITVANGTSISLPASTINVDVKDNAPAGEFTGGDKYGVSITCAPGTRGGSMQVPGLVLRDATNNVDIDVANGATVQIAVPPDAGGIALNFAARATQAGIVPIPAGSVAIQQCRGAVVLKEYDPVVFGQWVPLIGGSDNIKIHNFNAFHIQCGLVLGVDG
jgi:hypothetical protein